MILAISTTAVVIAAIISIGYNHANLLVLVIVARSIRTFGGTNQFFSPDEFRST
jgi:hypothetical protein